MSNLDRKCASQDCDLPGRFTDPSLKEWYCQHHRTRAMDFNQEEKIRNAEAARDEATRRADKYGREMKDLQKQVGHARNLLAVMHRDGGHYVGRHGFEKACKDAEQVRHDLMTEADTLRDLGMKLVTAVEFLGDLSMKPGYEQFRVALRELREFLCKR